MVISLGDTRRIASNPANSEKLSSISAAASFAASKSPIAAAAAKSSKLSNVFNANCRCSDSVPIKSGTASSSSNSVKKLSSVYCLYTSRTIEFI